MFIVHFASGTGRLRRDASLRTTPNTLTASLALLAGFLIVNATAQAQRRVVSALRQRGASAAVVVDERLAALREEPALRSTLVRRLGRGRVVSIVGAKRAQKDGVSFYRVAVTRRTRGWLQAESIASPARAGDDERLLRLIRGSEGFDRVARARIFLDAFTGSPLRPSVLLIYAEAAEGLAGRLTGEASRRLDEGEMRAGGAPLHSYFLNYNGLDRLSRIGVKYVFDNAAKSYHYDGAAWREILRRHPQSPEAVEARRRLESSPAHD